MFKGVREAKEFAMKFPVQVHTEFVIINYSGRIVHEVERIITNG